MAEIAHRCPPAPDLEALAPLPVPALGIRLSDILASVNDAVEAARDRAPGADLVALDGLARAVNRHWSVWQQARRSDGSARPQLEPTRALLAAVRDQLGSATVGSADLHDLIERLRGDRFRIEAPSLTS